jgi:FkbM family methyltransferase
MYLVSLRGLGYNNWISSINGEDRFARAWAAKHRLQPVTIFDIGANIGDFTATLLPMLQQAKFYLFEPNPRTFPRLRDRYGDHRNVTLEQVGVGANSGSLPLYDFQHGAGSERASFLIDTFSENHKTILAGLAASLITLDDYAQAKKIAFIDFLKIDTEGFEERVLSGAARMIGENRIAVIQLEMGAHNVISGLSLFRLTKLLPGFDIYRIVADGLQPMVSSEKPYSALLDIPRFCNLVAVNRASRARRETN